MYAIWILYTNVFKRYSPETIFCMEIKGHNCDKNQWILSLIELDLKLMINCVWNMNPTQQWIQKISLRLFPLSSFIIVIYTKQKRNFTLTLINKISAYPHIYVKTNHIKLMDV